MKQQSKHFIKSVRHKSIDALAESSFWILRAAKWFKPQRILFHIMGHTMCVCVNIIYTALSGMTQCYSTI